MNYRTFLVLILGFFLFASWYDVYGGTITKFSTIISIGIIGGLLLAIIHEDEMVKRYGNNRGAI